MTYLGYDKEKPDQIIITVDADSREESIQKAFDQIGESALVLTFEREVAE